MVLFSHKKRVPFLIQKGKDGKRMKKIKIFMGAVLCMNLLTLSGCDRVVQSAVVEEKDQTDQKKEKKRRRSRKLLPSRFRHRKLTRQRSRQICDRQTGRIKKPQ